MPGASTRLIWEQRRVPLHYAADYAVSNQLHMERLVAYLSGAEFLNLADRQRELLPAYQELAARL